MSRVILVGKGRGTGPFQVMMETNMRTMKMQPVVQTQVLIPVDGPMRTLPDDSVLTVQTALGGTPEKLVGSASRVWLVSSERTKRGHGVNQRASQMAGYRVHGPAVLVEHSPNW